MDWSDYPFTHVWNGSNVEYRPFIEAEIIAGREKFGVTDALVDSGCETTLINIDIAKKLKINLDLCEKTRVGGVGGSGIDGYFTNVIVHIPDFKFQYNSPVIFAEIPTTVILGQRGFFEHFRVHFERDQGIFRLGKPSSLEL